MKTKSDVKGGMDDREPVNQEEGGERHDQVKPEGWIGSPIEISKSFMQHEAVFFRRIQTASGRLHGHFGRAAARCGQ